jgi:hypothetical protein
MDNITLNLIALAVFVLLGAGIFFLVRRSQAENEQKIIRMAAEHGWTYESIREPLAWGMRLQTRRWTLEALSRSSGGETAPGSSDVAMSTTWHADAPGSTLLIGPRTSQVNLGGLGEALIRQVLGQALGADADGLTEVQAGSEAFHKRYMLWTREPVEAASLLTPALQSALLAWKGAPPVIKRTSEGLTLELNGMRLKKADDLRKQIMLGEVFL